LRIALEEDRVEVPLVPRLRATPAQLVSIALSELARPLTDSLSGHGEPASSKEFVASAVAERETAIEPDGGRDTLGRIAGALVKSRVSGGGPAHIRYEGSPSYSLLAELT
jgi:hypothetical protein